MKNKTLVETPVDMMCTLWFCIFLLTLAGDFKIVNINVASCWLRQMDPPLIMKRS